MSIMKKVSCIGLLVRNLKYFVMRPDKMPKNIPTKYAFNVINPKIAGTS